MSLGRLEKVKLREVWTTEDKDFTPWLALPANLPILSDTIGIELELEAHEKNVGPFRADILCKDSATDNWVLIENQLERTDHTHLGQLMTYAAGLRAVTIIWIAERFTDEHRAAIDWLNNITSKAINFFALEIELWKIGDSAIAPKFNIVAQPNDWSKTITAITDTEQITPTKQLQLNFWMRLREFLRENDSDLKPQKPLPQHWSNFAIGRSYFHISATVNTQTQRLGCILVMTGPDALAHFSLLQNDKTDIEREFDYDLVWRDMPGRTEKHVSFFSENRDLNNEDSWPEYYKWFANILGKFYSVFGQRIKQLDASQYMNDEIENS
ncbi:MAG: DUF4268 domain-containing protein [candidate division Zixibacteria bacterium]|nr:DUF4268 domain-containing protein [candidate division Zixibacteria bacterium]